ncbi:MAG: glycosyl hydrolase [Sphingomonas taxi]|uniref:Glycosyl hydrolase n=1 Tax=Sphingomonas taxi TaxID=1549858 RepID=A0A2W5PB07_9SPHN|nr:MAG: glycosyl hydrolase [Sphingomonas taxi]
MSFRPISLLTLPLLAAAGVPAQAQHAARSSAEQRAAATEARMTDEERVKLTIGIIPIPLIPGTPIPPDAIKSAGYVPGVPRLGVPNLAETDASLGVSWVAGLRGPEGATPLPSGAAMASTWNPALIRQGGATIGGEARAKGFNVLLAGGVNLVRDPRNGRNFEYLGEDPLLAGVLSGNQIAGVQSNNIISTIKHFAFNNTETARNIADSVISDKAARESDLLAFRIAIDIGQPGAVMCGYNRVNGKQACASDYLLNQVLKKDWGYKGFVMSDWGAVYGVEDAIAGLDQQSGAQLDKARYFEGPLLAKAAADPAYRARLADMNRRILYAIYAHGLDTHPATAGGTIDKEAGLAVARSVADEGIVLLKNERNMLPLARSVKRIAVIGGYADSGVLSGGGSSQVHMDKGPAAQVSLGGTGLLASITSEQYHRSTPPLVAIKALAKDAEVSYRNGFYLGEAVEAAKNADLVIMFANQWQTEGRDQPDMSLPRGQDALVAAVAAANPNTVVVLQTGSPVAMPWLDQVPAVVEAWYPGGRGGEAIAAVLFGDTNPSGRLPVTFPRSVDDLPRPRVPGMDRVDPEFDKRELAGPPIVADYDIEGADVGYRWNARQGKKALFPFGYGLSYTSFAAPALAVRGTSAQVTVRNTGQREGATLAQVYMTASPSGRHQRLAGFQKVWLKPGESKTVTIALEPRILADYAPDGFVMAAGAYTFAAGEDAERLGTPVTVRLPARRLGK